MERSVAVTALRFSVAFEPLFSAFGRIEILPTGTEARVTLNVGALVPTRILDYFFGIQPVSAVHGAKITNVRKTGTDEIAMTIGVDGSPTKTMGFAFAWRATTEYLMLAIRKGGYNV